MKKKPKKKTKKNRTSLQQNTSAASLTDINLKDDTGYTALQLAVQKLNFERIEWLLENGADPNIYDKNNLYPLHILIYLCIANFPKFSKSKEEKLKGYINLFKEKGANINQVNGENDTSLGMSIIMRNFLWAKFLVRLGADINQSYTIESESNQGKKLEATICPLLHAIALDEGFAKYLIVMGVELNFSSLQNVTPLYFAAETGKTELVKILLEKGADPDIETKNGWLPIYVAIKKRNNEMLRYFLEFYSKKPSIHSSVKKMISDINMSYTLCSILQTKNIKKMNEEKGQKIEEKIKESEKFHSEFSGDITQQKRETYNNHSFFIEKGYSAKEIKELKGSFYSGEETEPARKKPEPNEKVYYWFQGKLSSEYSDIRTIELAGNKKSFLYIDFFNLKKQGCCEFEKFISLDRIKFCNQSNNYGLKQIVGVDLFAQIKHHDAQYKVKITHELVLPSSEARVFFFQAPADNKNAKLYYGGFYLEKGLHTTQGRKKLADRVIELHLPGEADIEIQHCCKR